MLFKNQFGHMEQYLSELIEPLNLTNDITIDFSEVTMESTVSIADFNRLVGLTIKYVLLSDNFKLDITYYKNDGTLGSITHNNISLADLLGYFTTYFSNEIKGLGTLEISVADGLQSYLDLWFENVSDLLFDDIPTQYIVLFSQVSEKHVVDKQLIWIKNEVLKFNKPITYRKFNLVRKPVADELPFNYVYVSSLKRYYYIDDMVMTNEMCDMTLSEDVLMSHKELIGLQTAFIKRQENASYPDIEDNEVYCQLKKSITETTITPTNDIFKLYPYVGTGTDGNPMTVLDDGMRPCYVITVVSNL